MGAGPALCGKIFAEFASAGGQTLPVADCLFFARLGRLFHFHHHSGALPVCGQADSHQQDAAGDGAGAVSYTHLDVYKRQGKYKDMEAITLTDMRELIGRTQTGRLTEDELMKIEEAALPGVGTCAMLGTANTMSLSLIHISVMGLVVGITATLFSRQFNRMVSGLTRGLKAVADGDFSQYLEPEEGGPLQPAYRCV